MSRKLFSLICVAVIVAIMLGALALKTKGFEKNRISPCVFVTTGGFAASTASGDSARVIGDRIHIYRDGKRVATFSERWTVSGDCVTFAE